MFEFADTLSEQENLEDLETPLINIKQEECGDLGLVANESSACIKNLQLNLEPEFSVDDMIKSVNQSSEVTLQVLNKTMSGNMPVTPSTQTTQPLVTSDQLNISPLNSSPLSVKPESILDANIKCSSKSCILGHSNSKLVTKETKVYVHSVILAAKSEFFKLLLSTSGMKETKEKDVRIEVMCLVKFCGISFLQTIMQKSVF